MLGHALLQLESVNNSGVLLYAVVVVFAWNELRAALQSSCFLE